LAARPVLARRSDRLPSPSCRRCLGRRFFGNPAFLSSTAVRFNLGDVD